MEGVTFKDSGHPGNRVAIVGGVHGNESIGVETLKWARETIVPERGSIYFIEGNPEAIKQGVRFIETNLNRCFRNTNGSTIEELRARELSPFFDECDALLDIHSSNSEKSIPFIICEESGLSIAKLLDFPIVSTGWDALEPGGTDGYMNSRGKIGITIECGSVHRPHECTELARESVVRFLKHMKILSSEHLLSPSKNQRHIRAYVVEHKDDRPVVFSKDYADFEPLTPGEVFAQQGTVEHIARDGDCIIFPRPNAKPGAEIFLLGKELT